MRIFAAAFLALGFVSVTAHAGNVVLNGDFASGDLSSWLPFTTANGTNGASLPNVVSFNTGSGASLAAHFDVGEVNFTSAQEGGGLTQTFILGSGGTFTLSANIASQDDADGQVNGDAGTFSVLIDGTTIATDSLGAFATANQVILGTLSNSAVSLGVGPHTLEILITRPFTSEGSATPDEYIDNISLSSSSAVPEPGTFGLIGLALAGLGLWQRRRV